MLGSANQLWNLELKKLPAAPLGERILLKPFAPDDATEAALDGKQPVAATADAAVAALESEINPIDDVRSTAEYRKVVAGRVLRRLIREEGGW